MPLPRLRPPSRAGFSLVELLLALVLAGIGVLAAARGLALAFRLTGTAAHQVEAARLARSVAAELTGRAAGGTAPCAAVAAPPATGPGGVTVQTSTRPDSGGVELSLTLQYTGPGGPRQDTLWSFLRCR